MDCYRNLANIPLNISLRSWWRTTSFDQQLPSSPPSSSLGSTHSLFLNMSSSVLHVMTFNSLWIYPTNDSEGIILNTTVLTKNPSSFPLLFRDIWEGHIRLLMNSIWAWVTRWHCPELNRRRTRPNIHWNWLRELGVNQIRNFCPRQLGNDQNIFNPKSSYYGLPVFNGACRRRKVNPLVN